MANKKIKLILPFFIILTILLVSTVLLAMADFPTSYASLVVDSGDCGLVVDPSEDPVDTDNLNPGDIKTSYLDVKNTKDITFKYYLDIQQVKSIIGSYPGLEGKHLEKVLKLKVERQLEGEEREVLFEGYLHQFEELDMGILEGYEEERIYITVELPGPETGNEYQGASLFTRFLFRSSCDIEEERPARPTRPRPPRPPDEDIEVPPEPPDVEPEPPEIEPDPPDVEPEPPEVEPEPPEVEPEPPEVEPEPPEVEPEPPEVEPEPPEVEPEPPEEEEPIVPPTWEMPPYIYYAIGGILILMGLILGKRRREKDK